jgi:hypothetical protein
VVNAEVSGRDVLPDCAGYFQIVHRIGHEPDILMGAYKKAGVQVIKLISTGYDMADGAEPDTNRTMRITENSWSTR